MACDETAQPKPQACRNDDGEVGITWFSGDDCVLLSVEPATQTIEWGGQFDGCYVSFGSTSFPPELKVLLARLGVKPDAVN